MSINYSSNRNHGVHSNLALTANGTTNASTTVIGASSVFNEITTCTSAAYAVVLPEHPRAQLYHIVNKGAYPALIFPHSDGTSTIDGGASFMLGNNGCSVSFFPAALGAAASNAKDVTWRSVSKTGKSVIAADDDLTLLASVNYDTIVNITQSSAFTITLPAPAAANAGMKVLFNLAVVGAYTVDIQGGAAGKVTGTLLNDSATGTQADHIEGVAQLSIDFDSGAVVSDRVEALSDGVQWGVLAVSSGTGKLSFTA